MKIDRRNFLSLGIGATAGLTLSPLPWKLMDDSSIWTQNWPWTPVPEDGEVNHVSSACTLCPGGCGISVRKVGNRAVKIEGLKGHPVNDGGVCVLGLSGLQLLYGPRRVKTPLRRSGQRGEGKWEEISWDEAVAELAKKLGALRSKGKSHTLACISGSAKGSMPALWKRFLKGYGSPNFMSAVSIRDSYELTMELMNGVRAFPRFDLANTDLVLSFGSGLLDGWISPVRMFKANSSWKNENVKVIQIEPRLSNTAAKADKWIPVNPGTEAALAFGMANVIISESLYNKKFVENNSYGFEEFKQFVFDKYDLENVSKITGIKKSDIIFLAKVFAGASKPIALCGRGQGGVSGSISEFMAVHALNGIVGSINKKGGIWAVPESEYIQWPEPKLDKTARIGIQKERIDGAGSDKFRFAKSLADRLPEVINSAKETVVNALFIAGTNPLYAMPDTNSVKKAFDRIPYVVSFSPYMDETTQNADLVLPNHTYLERYEDLPVTAGLQQTLICLAKPVVEPLFKTRHTGDLIIELAGRLGGTIAEAFPWESYETCLKETLGEKWDTLVAEGYVAEADDSPPGWSYSFKTPSGKFEFASSDAGSLYGLKPIKVEGDDRTYPLVLIPYDSMRLANGSIGAPPFVIKTVSDTVLKGNDGFVEVNPETALAVGLRDGKYAVLSTPKGKAQVRVHFFDGIMPGVIAMPRGLGHTGSDMYLAEKGININELIGTIKDPVSGFNAAWGIRANLAKA